MKKNIVFIFIATLILNLLPKISAGWTLAENNTKLIYNNDKEKKDWENYHLPHAKYSKLISPNTTVLDIAIMAQKEAQANPAKETIVHKIQKNTRYARQKMFLKWEKENKYTNEKIEENFEITPSLRCTLLKEIETEEEKERKEISNFGWKFCKTAVTTMSFFGTFGVSKYKGISTTEATKLTALIFMGLSMVISIGEFGVETAGKKLRQLWNGEEEIKLPPLQNLPELP